MFDKFTALLAPHLCLVCGREGSLICDWCFNEAVLFLPSRCYRCKRLTDQYAVCKSCRGSVPLLNVWVRGSYDGTAHDLVHGLKFNRARRAAYVIALYLDEVVDALPPDVVVTYVPTASHRVRIRGYDQTRLIAREFARLRNYQCCSLMVSIGQSRQVGATRSDRRKQAANHYQLKPRVVIPGRVLIIDDIVTTGATIESAATLLKSGGAKKVYAAVFAQKE